MSKEDWLCEALKLLSQCPRGTFNEGPLFSRLCRILNVALCWDIGIRKSSIIWCGRQNNSPQTCLHPNPQDSWMCQVRGKWGIKCAGEIKVADELTWNKKIFLGYLSAQEFLTGEEVGRRVRECHVRKTWLATWRWKQATGQAMPQPRCWKSPANTPMLAPSVPFQTSNLQNSKRINLLSFELLTLW